MIPIRSAMQCFVSISMLFAGVCLRAEEPAVTLARVYKPGTVARYKSHSISGLSNAVAVGGGTQAEFNTTARQFVKAVKPTGDVMIELTPEGGNWILDGDSHEIPATPPIRFTLNRYGRLLAYQTNEANQDFVDPTIERLMASVRQTLFPTGPVRPGESWENQLDNPAVKEKKITIKNTFLGIEKVNGADCWKVKQQAVAVVDAAGTEMTDDLTVWLDTKDGHEVKSENRAANIPTQFGVASLQTTAEQITLKPKKKKPTPTPSKTYSTHSRPRI